MSYAAQTSVPVDRSKSELERLLGKHGATHFAYMTDSTGAIVAFRMRDRDVRFLMPMPDWEEFRWSGATRRRKRTDTETKRAWDQAVRSRWRALVLIVKAKLEAVAAGVSTFEREFLADIMLPGGFTVHESIQDEIERVYQDQMSGPIRLQLPERASV